MNITIMPGYLGTIYKTISHTAVRKGEGARKQVVVKTEGGVYLTRHIVMRDGKWWAQIMANESAAIVQEVKT